MAVCVPLSECERLQSALDQLAKFPITLISINPTGAKEKGSAYLKLSQGRLLLVTLPQLDLSDVALEELSKRIEKKYFIKTIVLIAQKEQEMNWRKKWNFSILCDPENALTSALGLLEVDEDFYLKEPESPQQSFIFLNEGKVLHQGTLKKERGGLFEKISEIAQSFKNS